MLSEDYRYFEQLFQDEPPLTDDSLTEWISIISLRCFNAPFTHDAKVNKRLKTTGGRYHLTSHHIDINPLVYTKYGWEELVNVILHELCHYHLHLTGRGYQHRDKAFKLLLKAVGGSRYVKPLVEKETRYHYRCQKCQLDYYRQKKIDLNRYRCKCFGDLVMITLE
ncbi:SprT family protein [Vagococcus xieshaowenii]|uniref:SprT family protein n=1 Tax=Vagococcus xieshaowenii TaxID=2562451 RepID=A0AAJ5EE86_9ENTE|nr:SprT family protein [Vagococcus xieshaowenii]QCA29058.1 SprT family protein [Vagococcus xieshaowenii]TFZ40966.1 SprT family protein [Vagococcus xieshaowenii]